MVEMKPGWAKTRDGKKVYVIGRAPGVLERREAIEALGDSNPPAMSEVIGHMIAATFG